MAWLNELCLSFLLLLSFLQLPRVCCCRQALTLPGTSPGARRRPGVEARARAKMGSGMEGWEMGWSRVGEKGTCLDSNNCT